ncbi:misacylated tRNA(Ala) deacylase [Breoghania corrubedonensis]|uniref:Alanine--tRNA ligase n=1 Tax=Breoghania corrubedonensis TaxID=665038 RepID=A0A2T5VBH1_9HYPH|nr:alanyl-tRNA editing protein [Breoghania corrubedonensis]PTW61103.1 misacylated tRNA(Ala) deacylase [Breoghania corrubedonensis]
MTEALFRDDSYLQTCQARVTGVNERGGILLDRSIFFATGGGQPGDTGMIERPDGSSIAIGATVFGESKEQIVHVPAAEGPLPDVGETIVATIDWHRRYRHMRMHTALHIICAAMRTKITGAQIGEEESRIDLNMQDPPDRDAVLAAIMEAVNADHPVTTEWITDAQLDANPDLIKSMSVSPPRGSGLVRLVRIGANFDLQPCGGTHVRTTSEIGQVTITKIEKKGRLNRRIRIRLDD